MLLAAKTPINFSRTDKKCKMFTRGFLKTNCFLNIVNIFLRVFRLNLSCVIIEIDGWRKSCLLILHVYTTSCKNYEKLKTIRRDKFESKLDLETNFVFFFRVEEELIFRLSKHFARGGVYHFGGKFLRKLFSIFLLGKLPGETLCKFFQIFPPKVLVYIGKNISSHFLIDLIEFLLTN